MAHKIAIIGAGSAIFSLNLIKDLCINEHLKDFTVSLMDINEARLHAIYSLAERYLKETSHDLIVEKTTDRRACLKGADFVIHVALDYGHARMKEGWDIARRHGYRFGGSLHIVHDEAFWVNFYQLRLMESVLNDVLDICPDAYFILVANPVQAGVTYLKRKYPAANIVGLCHGYKDVDRLSRAIGIDSRETTYEVCGVNHFIWLTKYYHNGEDAYPVLDRWIANGGADAHLKRQGCKSINEGPKAIDLYKRFGVFPIGDTCTPGGGSWGWWYHTPEQEERFAEDPRAWYDQYFTLCDTTIRKIQSVVNDPVISVVDAFSSEPSVEPMIPLIEAIACDRERVIIVNILNTGCFVPGVPADYEVEIPALVSKKGIQGIQTGGLPAPVMTHLLRDRVAQVEMELIAFASGNRDDLKALVLMDPWTKSEEQADALLDAILAMPCNSEMKAYFAGKQRSGNV